MSKEFTRRNLLRIGALAAAAPAVMTLAPTSPALASDDAPDRGGAGSKNPRPGYESPDWQVKPFALNQVALHDGIFQQKRDRMLNYARNYPGTGGVFDGPDRMLYSFRVNAGLPAPGTWPGGWDTPTQLLRGHFSGHYMSMLAQCWASTGEEIFLDKLDYLVEELGKCQNALDARPVGRVAGRAGKALRLSDPHPNQYVQLPAGMLADVTDVTIAAWVNLGAAQNNAKIFSFGASANVHLSLTARVSATSTGPRFAISKSGSSGEQAITASSPIPVGQWAHVAVTLSGGDGTGRLYVNGVQAGTAAIALTPASLGATSRNYIGRSQGDDPLLNTTVDDFRIYRRALDGTEVQALTAENPDAPAASASDLVVWYRFDAEGETAGDRTPNHRDATIIGTSYPGFLAAFPEGQFSRIEPPMLQPNSGPNAVWAPWYTCHKIMRGLLNAYNLTGNEEALGIVMRMGDWVCQRLSRYSQADVDKMWDTYSAGEAGSMNEVMAELSALADSPQMKAQYLAAAKKFTFSTLFTASIAERDVLNGRHANQYMAPNIGYLRIFELTREQDYHTAPKNFWSMVVPHRTFSNGGAGRSEHFGARDVITSGFTSSSDPAHAESCCVYNMLRLTRNLFFHDPDPAYMDYYEKGLHNQILSSRHDVDSVTATEVTYYQSMWPGRSRKINSTIEYSRYGANGSCCNGTGLENHTKYQETIYFSSADESTLYVNLFIASTLTWPDRGFVVTQETRYPTEGASRLRFDRAGGQLKVKLRVPSWATQGYTVRVNGQRQPLVAKPGSYVTVERHWSTGDTIDIEMPMSFRVEQAIDNKAIQSIMYGPSLMVILDATPSYRDLTFYRELKLNGDLASSIKPTGAPMQFTTHGYTLRPYYVSDPVPGQYDAYHPYVRRVEPEVVFGSHGSGVPNDTVRDRDGMTFLDRVWAEAPFVRYSQFFQRVQQVSAEWVTAGRYTDAQRQGILAAAAQAQGDLDDTVPVTVTVQPRSIAGQAYLAVQVRNDHDSAVDIAVETLYGDRTFAAVAPGANAYQSFAVRAATVPAGAVIVRAIGIVGGKSVTTTITAEYGAFSL
ncbi:beta-L-arabinofuranosidase domain-containing protein [Dactylosporangium sp. CA-233914]|uniref:beta-L-arabinofuranosidase domain-containing protein n=1 Tax=Dactylosporangium sp. CA-233914 TaxID=3239934 RepID=UPI003D8C521C